MVSTALFRDIKKYVCRLYGQLSTDDVHLARFNLFSIGQYAENTMACTKNVLLQHANRASYQCRIWKSALQPVMSPPSICEFGWEVNEGLVNIRWMTMPAAPDGILENVNCGCKSGCSTRRCACRKAELNCTGLCSCCDCTNAPENSLSDDEDDDGLLFELDGDDTELYGIFEEQ